MQHVQEIVKSKQDFGWQVQGVRTACSVLFADWYTTYGWQKGCQTKACATWFDRSMYMHHHR